MAVAGGAGLAELVEPDAELRLLASGYQFTEGPVWNAAEGALYYSDIPGDARWRWTEERGPELAGSPTFKGNGMAYDLDGSLLVCEQVSSCLVRVREGGGHGKRELVAFHYRGRYLNSPNDVVVRSDGSIFFTDPDYGRWNDWIGQERSRNGVGYRGLYRVPPGGGDLELLVGEDEFDEPNGLCFSPDERVLYVNDSGRTEVKAFPVAADGSLGAGRLLRGGIGTGVPRQGNVDGMECDELGNVWVTGPGGVWVLSPEGEHLGVVPTPEVAGSLAWGGADLRTLYVCTSTTLHSIRTRVAGAPLPPER
jgi:gluconolactonase